jgi:hypothetical protein
VSLNEDDVPEALAVPVSHDWECEAGESEGEIWGGGGAMLVDDFRGSGRWKQTIEI